MKLNFTVLWTYEFKTLKKPFKGMKQRVKIM